MRLAVYKLHELTVILYVYCILYEIKIIYYSAEKSKKEKR